MLKPAPIVFAKVEFWQPPSGGCVLKPLVGLGGGTLNVAATFGWLCVETTKQILTKWEFPAATFGWLCVETPFKRWLL